MSDIEKTIIYSLIAKNDKHLAEYSHFTGTFSQACVNYLKKIEPNSSKAIQIDDFNLFYVNDNNISYMIMAGKLFPKEGAIGCLESIKREFNQTYVGRDFDGELAYGLNDEFKEKLKLKIDYFNENPDVSDDKLEKLKEQMSLMKNEIITASGLLDDRSAKIQVLDNKADLLSRDSNTYYRQSKRVKQAERWKKIKIIIGISVAALVILYVIFGSFCGFDFGCFSSSEN